MAASALRCVEGQPGWRVAARGVEVFVTRTGGQIAPVRFRLGPRTIQPLHIAPWAGQALAARVPAMLKVLRGDFFCMPFGGNDTPWRGERHPPHGQTANNRWSLIDTAPGRLRLALRTTVRRGRVEKQIHLKAGQTALYQRHILSGLSGPMSLGHHAMLRFPDQPGAGLVSTSPFRAGRTPPVPFERPEQRGYSLLRPDTVFHALHRVPCITAEMADLSRYPARRGFEDLVMLASEPADFAWTAVVFPCQRYVWFALKDPRILPATILWHSNGGRHYAPWDGRHLNVLGLEEVCSYFHYGLAESVRPNAFSRQGVPTVHRLDPRRPLVVNYIMAVAAVPATFTHIQRIEREKDHVILIDRRDRRVRCAVDVDFLAQTA